MIKSHTEHKLGNEARKLLIKGVHAVAEVVRTTLGAKGNIVAWAGRHNTFGLTQDGVSVAKRIELKNLYENIGARILQQADMQTDKDVGDGTTTTTVIADALLTEIEKNYAYDGRIDNFDSVRLVQELESARDKVIANLQKQKKDISTPQEVRNVAYVSSLSDEIANILSEMYEKLGRDMLVVFDTNMYGNTLRYTIEEGMEINSGWVSRGMATDGNTMECVLENVPIFVTDEKIESPDYIRQLADKTFQFKGQKNIVIIADDFSEAAVAIALINKLKGGWNILLIKAPSLGVPKLWWLEDIAALTGATFISKTKGRSLAEAQTQHLGTAKKIVASEFKTMLIGSVSKAGLKPYVDEIRNQMKNEKDKSIHEKRISKLTSGIGRIEIGGHTRQHAEEVRDKIKDAVHSVQAALRGGVVQGGGFALLSASRTLEQKNDGEKLLTSALTQPMFWIAQNGGFNGNDIVSKCKDKGFNVNTGKYEDFFKTGVVDAYPVVESSLRKAITVASQIIRTSSVIIMVEREVKETPHEAYDGIETVPDTPTAEEVKI